MQKMKKLYLLLTQVVTIFLAIYGLYNLFWNTNAQTPTLIIPSGNVSYKNALAKPIQAVGHVFITDHRHRPGHLWALMLGEKNPKASPVGVGSGILMDKKGHMLTNAHVIEGAKSIFVHFANQMRYSATLIAQDKESDLALLKIQDWDGKYAAILPHAQMQNLSVGDVIFAVGNPFGMSHSATMGMISALNRTHDVLDASDDFIQIDAPVNPGNSGGALITAQGELAGMVSAMYSDNGGNNGIAYAIPIDRLEHIYQQFLTHGKVKRGWLGVQLKDMDGKYAKAFHLKNPSGVLIAGFLPQSPAQSAGIQVGDVLLKINETEIVHSKQAIRTLKHIAPGEVAHLTIQRQLTPMQIDVVLKKRPQD